MPWASSISPPAKLFERRCAVQKVAKDQKGKDFEAARDCVRHTFEDWVIKSIEITFRATSESEGDGKGGTPLAAFLLLSCGIDAISGFYAGRTSEHGTGAQYKSFVRKYMPTYSPENMYEKLRCALAHNFAVDQGLALTHGQSHLHNVRDLTGETIVKNFENVFFDFQAGIKRYFEDLDSSDDLKLRFMNRFRKFGLASPVEFKWQAAPTSAGLNFSGPSVTG
jgi:hypothetical protein